MSTLQAGHREISKANTKPRGKHQEKGKVIHQNCVRHNQNRIRTEIKYERLNSTQVRGEGIHSALDREGSGILLDSSTFPQEKVPQPSSARPAKGQ